MRLRLSASKPSPTSTALIGCRFEAFTGSPEFSARFAG
jgi:hypothetical protein